MVFTDDSYNDFIQELKSTVFSKSKFPKLILGTGLSLSYGVPGMRGLTQKLDDEFDSVGNEGLKKIWFRRKQNIKDYGLEEGLKDVIYGVQEDRDFVEFIKTRTAKYILTEELKLIESHFFQRTGFSRMLEYLSKSASSNHPILDIMTPNYDRIIEFVCDYLSINCIDGFRGKYIKQFDYQMLREPKSFYNKSIFSIRLFKPHGSISWVLNNGRMISRLDSNWLLEHFRDIQIITPGTSKYEIGLTNDTFRLTREYFNESLSQNNFSFFIFGYGFNDEHFNTVIYSKLTEVPILIVSKSIKEEVIEKALANGKVTLIYSIDDKTYVIYRQNKYVVDKELWNLDVLASELFAE